MKESYPIYKTGIGEDSHRFLSEDLTKPCILAGVVFEDVPGLAADSDGDAVYHSICRAITSINSFPILDTVAKDLCLNQGITDSKVYLEKAFESLKNLKVVHVAISIEAKRPKIFKKTEEMRKNISSILKIDISQVGIVAHSGEGLTECGCGMGIQSTCCLTVVSF
ncbi:MAG: 2-C-methyl-D-erythritol 2,4-cyclodiphosphate synthase [Parachlamydiales bacterium]|jgi:2-C-methyl-D-erythritol 2,4-cyclodiphosphate synthase